LIDLDGFKTLNDTFGHETGDSFLQHLATCLRAVIGERGSVARLGGDEFAVLIPAAEDLTEVAGIAQAVDLAVRAPVTVAGITVDVRGSIGVAASPLHGEDRTTLLRHADFAMYRAKERGGGVAVHNDQQGGRVDRPSLIAALREAIQNSGLNLQYQPKVLLGTEEVVGVEALLRWTHPIYGSISPDQVIPVAETSGLIGPLTRWVLATALAQCGAWHREGIDLNVAVNLSPTQIDDVDVVTQVRSLLALHELPPEALTLEITESAGLNGQIAENISVLEELAALGVRLSIDDFGTGTSSLARMRRFPVSEVKIDKSFITNLNADPKDVVVVSSTVSLAHQLGLDVVAEGVETLMTSEQLRSLGCDIAQGYLFSPPLHPEDLIHWIRTHSRIASSAESPIIPFSRRSALKAVGQLRSS
jgi:diguanylate cyclase (GGDEF)-like protein